MAKLYVGACGSLVLNESCPSRARETLVLICTLKAAEPPTATLVGKPPTSAKPAGRLRLLSVSDALPGLFTENVSVCGGVLGPTLPKSIGVVRPLATNVLP